MKITISKSDKFHLPNVFESSGLSFSMDFEIPENLTPDEIRAKTMECKNLFEHVYWPLANYDMQTFLQRISMGAEQFLHWKINS
jgi:hypothetical protein